MKTCYTCKEEKALSEYYKHKQKPDGLEPNCKPCASYKRAYAQHRQNARRKAITFKLEKDYFYEIIDKPCYYCGGVGLNRNGLDRLDNDKGYVKDNIVSCCATCNRAKSSELSPSQMDTYISLIRVRREPISLTISTELDANDETRPLYLLQRRQRIWAL